MRLMGTYTIAYLSLSLTCLVAGSPLIRLPTDVRNWTYDSPEANRFWDRKFLRHAVGSINYNQVAQFLRKLNAGQAVFVLAVGSSITADGGGTFASAKDSLTTLVRTPTSQRHSVNGWLRNFMLMINATWPHRDHLLYNAGKAGNCFIGYATQSCFETSLPSVELDLVIGEFMPHGSVEWDDFNDRFYRTNTALFEQFMRRMHAHSQAIDASSPPYIFIRPLDTLAVDRVSHFPNCTFLNDAAQPPVSGNASAEWVAEERVHSVVKYYGQTSLSFRYMFHAAEANSLLGNISECEYTRRLWIDTVHPSRLGSVLYADLLLSVLSDTEHFISQAAGDISRTPLAMPAYALTPDGRNAWHMRCYGDMPLLDQLAISADTSLRTEGDTHEALVILQRQGWVRVVNQTHVKHPDAPPKYKPGWMSTVVNATMRIQVNTAFQSTSSAPSHATISLLYLQSYAHMGTASVACVLHCACPSVVIDAHSQNRVSITAYFDMKLVTPHAACVLEFRILPHTSSPDGEHKFKLIQVVVKAPL